MSGRLRDRVCVVTGSTGMAAATASELAAEGASIWILSRTPEHVAGLVDRVRAKGGQIDGDAVELTDEAATAESLGRCVRSLGRIDGLFAVAGGSGRRFGDGPIHTVTRAAWDRTLEMNLTTQALVCSAVVARMRTQEPNDSGTRGSILLMGSVTARHPAPEFFATHAYAAARAATVGLMRTMAAAYLQDRIRVNVVAPGLTDTPMARRAKGDDGIRAYAARKQPLAGALMDPAEVAHAAVFLLSDESRAITGQVLNVDGGWSVASVSPEPQP